MKKFLSLVLVVLFALGCVTGCGAKTGGSSSQSDDTHTNHTNTQTPAESTPKSDPEPAPDDTLSDTEIDSAITGVWVWEDSDGNKMPYIFNGDGTGSAVIFPLTYTVEDGIITMEIQGFDKEPEVLVAEYTVSDDTLLIEADGKTAVLYRGELEE